MCELNTPNSLIYLHLLTAFFCFFSGFFILFNSKKNPANLNIAISIFIMGLWVFFMTLQWIITDVSLNLFFGRITTLISFISLFFLYFAYHFTEREINLKKKIFFALVYLPILLSLFSDYNLSVSTADTCSFAQGSMYNYVYFVTISYAVWAIVLLIKKYRAEMTTTNLKLQIKIMISNIAFLVFWIIFFALIENYVTLQNNTAAENEVVSFFLLGVMVFIAIIVYVIYKGALFQIGKLPKNIFVGVLWAILFLIIFVIQPGTAFSITAFVLYLFLITIFWIL